ncbi:MULTISPECIES: hypothetical protein [unclassified Lonepinella]|uniref:hypothetical protein n=1 Tax=unclassified Lonepinella TaxID=2642006 RepID=UPI0036D7AD2C
MNQEKTNEMPEYIIQGIERGIEELRQGKGISNQEIHQKARLFCDNRIPPKKMKF